MVHVASKPAVDGFRIRPVTVFVEYVNNPRRGTNAVAFDQEAKVNERILAASSSMNSA